MNLTSASDASTAFRRMDFHPPFSAKYWRILVLSQAKNINKPRTSTYVNLAISQASSGNPDIIENIKEAITYHIMFCIPMCNL